MCATFCLCSCSFFEFCCYDLLPGGGDEVQRDATNTQWPGYWLRRQQRCVSLLSSWNNRLIFVHFTSTSVFCTFTVNLKRFVWYFSDGIQWWKTSCSLGWMSQVSCYSMMTFFWMDSRPFNTDIAQKRRLNVWSPTSGTCDNQWKMLSWLLGMFHYELWGETLWKYPRTIHLLFTIIIINCINDLKHWSCEVENVQQRSIKETRRLWPEWFSEDQEGRLSCSGLTIVSFI